MENKISISPYSKIKVQWSDRPENYSKEGKNKIKNHFAKKYGLNKNNIDVIYNPVKFNESGDAIEITGANIENIMDTTYQRELMKEWLKRENKTIDFNRILNLDDKVNGELNLDDTSTRHNTWSIKWLMINNFLSFGEENYVPFNKLRGLTVVNSIPSNTGGKTSLTIDSLKFLLHGNTTKTDKNEEIFNTYSDKNDLVVRGMIEIGGEEIIIERKMKRTAKKGGGWTVTNRVNYYELLPDGEEKALNEEDATRTTAKLRATIGSEKDFEMLVLATEKNLDDLIGLTTTESGKVLTRLIGLEVIEMKEAVVRKMYNEFDKKKKSNEHDVITLNDDINEHLQKIEICEGIKETLTNRHQETLDKIESLRTENDRLLNSKITVDVVISALNPSKLQNEVDQITESGKTIKSKADDLKNRINEIGNPDFDEDYYHKLTLERNKVLIDLGLKKGEITRLENNIKNLIDGGICKSCNRKLDDVDNTEHIEAHKKSIEDLTIVVNELLSKETVVKDELSGMVEVKTLVDTKIKLELEKDRAEVEVGSLRNKVVDKMNDLKKYKLNEQAIEFNRSVDAEVSMVKTNIQVEEKTRDDIFSKLEKIKQDINLNIQSIDAKNKLIEQIKKEEEIDKIFKVYIELFGKKGISKLVLRSVLPIINSEVARLLEDVCEFEVEIFIDDKNDVQFLLIKDGVSKLLKSGSGFEKTAASLALRGVLGKISTLPMPNFITFDEILGKVANENIDKLKPLFDKISNMYEIVFLITHNDIIKDWATKILTVIKEGNISKVNLLK